MASVGLNVIDVHRISGELRYRYFGPPPLIEDDSVRSNASNLVSARLGCRVGARLRLDLDVFNLLNAKVSDVDYFYASRLRGEPAAGIDGVRFLDLHRSDTLPTEQCTCHGDRPVSGKVSQLRGFVQLNSFPHPDHRLDKGLVAIMRTAFAHDHTANGRGKESYELGERADVVVAEKCASMMSQAKRHVHE